MANPVFRDYAGELYYLIRLEDGWAWTDHPDPDRASIELDVDAATGHPVEEDGTIVQGEHVAGPPPLSLLDGDEDDGYEDDYEDDSEYEEDSEYGEDDEDDEDEDVLVVGNWRDFVATHPIQFEPDVAIFGDRLRQRGMLVTHIQRADSNRDVRACVAGFVKPETAVLVRQLLEAQAEFLTESGSDQGPGDGRGIMVDSMSRVRAGADIQDFVDSHIDIPYQLAHLLVVDPFTHRQPDPDYLFHLLASALETASPQGDGGSYEDAETPPPPKSWWGD